MTVKKISERTRLEIEAGRRTAAKHQRAAVMEQWQKERRIVVGFTKFGFVTVCIGLANGTYLDDLDNEYPSERLFARVALALNAGMDRKRDCGNIACDGPESCDAWPKCTQERNWQR